MRSLILQKLSILTLIFAFLIIFPYQMSGEIKEDRIYGADRVETALAVCESGWSSAKAVILAPADQANLVDALAAAALAGQEDAPILLTYKHSLDSAVKSRIIALGADKVYIVGGIAEQVVGEVAAIPGVAVKVLKGQNRWSTVKAINDELANPYGTFVVGYDALPDALSVASYAAKNRFAIILADPEGNIPAGQFPLGTEIYIVGGPSLVKDIPGAVRIYGTDRYATNMKIADTFAYAYNRIYVANGQTGHLVDSLTAAPLAAKDNAFIALSDGSSIPAAAVVNQKLSNTTQIIALGGPGLISERVRSKLGESSVPFGIESLQALSSTQLEIKFNKEVDQNSILVGPQYDKLKSGVLKIERDPYHDGVNDIDSDYMYAEFGQDGKTLTLRVHNRTYLEGKYKVSINPGVVVTKEKGEVLGAYSTVINVKDTTPPEVKEVRYNEATDRLEVVMSEVCDTLPSVTVNSGGNEFLSEDAMRTVLSFPNQWPRKQEISVRVFGAVDYAGNRQPEPYDIKLSIPMTESPLDIISVRQTDSNEFEVVFSKAVAPCDDDNLRVKNVKEALVVLRNGVPIKVSRIEIDSNDKSKRTYRVILDSAGAPNYDLYADNPMLNLSVFVEEGRLLDVYGNANLEIMQDFRMTIDSKGPQIISTRLTWDNDAFVLRFDEDIPDLYLGDVLHVRQSGVDTTDRFSVIPITTNTPNPREVKIVYRAGGTPIPEGIYTISLDKNAIPDKHWNYSSAQSVEIKV